MIITLMNNKLNYIQAIPHLMTLKIQTKVIMIHTITIITPNKNNNNTNPQWTYLHFNSMMLSKDSDKTQNETS